MPIWLLVAVAAAFAIKLFLDRELDRAAAAAHVEATGELPPRRPWWPPLVLGGVVAAAVLLVAAGWTWVGTALVAAVLVATVVVLVLAWRWRPR